MNARFLRDEAARFRGMAEDAGRDATRLRLLAMADDYEARAALTNEVIEQVPVPADDGPAEAPDQSVEAVSEAVPGDTLRLKPGRKLLADRRPAARRG